MSSPNTLVFLCCSPGFLCIPSFPFDCSSVSVELLRDHADAGLHLHPGGGPLAASSSRNSLSLGARRRSLQGATRACQVWGSTSAVDRGWTWKLHQWSNKGLSTPGWQVMSPRSPHPPTPPSLFFLLQTVDPSLSLQRCRHSNLPRAVLIVQRNIWVGRGGWGRRLGVGLHQHLLTSTLHLAKHFYDGWTGQEEFLLERERRLALQDVGRRPAREMGRGCGRTGPWSSTLPASSSARLPGVSRNGRPPLPPPRPPPPRTASLQQQPAAGPVQESPSTRTAFIFLG